MLNFTMFSSFSTELAKIAAEDTGIGLTSAGAGGHTGVFTNSGAANKTVPGRKNVPAASSNTSVVEAPTRLKPNQPTQTAVGAGGKLPGPPHPGKAAVADWEAHRARVMAGHENASSVMGHAAPHPLAMHAPAPGGGAASAGAAALGKAKGMIGSAAKRMGKGGLVAAGLGAGALGLGAMSSNRQAG